MPDEIVGRGFACCNVEGRPQSGSGRRLLPHRAIVVDSFGVKTCVLAPEGLALVMPNQHVIIIDGPM